MTKPTCDGSNIDTGADQLRGGEMTKIVQSNIIQSKGVAHSGEKTSDVIGSKRLGSVKNRGEDERIFGDRDLSLLRPIFNVPSMKQEESHADLVKSNGAEAVGLCPFLSETTGNNDHRPRHIQLASLEVHVGPTQCTQLTSPHPS